MRIESLREVKAKFSQIVKSLPKYKSVVVTKNGRPCAVLLPVTEETDLESLLLTQRSDFWELFDRAHVEGEARGFTKFKDLPDWKEFLPTRLSRSRAGPWGQVVV